MKKSVAITAVLSFHVAVIGILLAQAGCSSDSPAPQATEAKTSVGEINQVKTSSPDVNAAMKEKDEVVLPPEGSQALRANPTRPAPEEKTEKMQGDKNLVNEPIEPIKPAPSADKNLATYKVKKGDNPARIAKKHGVSVVALLEVNGMTKSSSLKIGEEIKIPANGIIAPVEAEVKPMQAANVSQESELYTVVRGDSLSRIAKNHHMSVKQLMTINNLKNHNIRAGQKLHVAKGDATAAPASSVEKTSATSTTQKSAVSKGGKKKAAKPVEVAEGEVTHTVASGETLGAIAIKYGTKIKAICEKNKISDPRKLRAGQVLIIKTSKVSEVKKADAKKPETTQAAKPQPQEPKLEIQSDASQTPVQSVIQTAPVQPAQPATTAPAAPVVPNTSAENVPILNF